MLKSREISSRQGGIVTPADIREFLDSTFPRGPRGSAQNIFRSGLYNSLRNAYGRKPQLPRNIEVIVSFVVNIVRHEVDPNFVPATESI